MSLQPGKKHYFGPGGDQHTLPLQQEQVHRGKHILLPWPPAFGSELSYMGQSKESPEVVPEKRQDAQAHHCVVKRPLLKRSLPEVSRSAALWMDLDVLAGEPPHHAGTPHRAGSCSILLEAAGYFSFHH